MKMRLVQSVYGCMHESRRAHIHADTLDTPLSYCVRRKTLCMSFSNVMYIRVRSSFHSSSVFATGKGTTSFFTAILSRFSPPLFLFFFFSSSEPPDSALRLKSLKLALDMNARRNPGLSSPPVLIPLAKTSLPVENLQGPFKLEMAWERQPRETDREGGGGEQGKVLADGENKEECQGPLGGSHPHFSLSVNTQARCILGEISINHIKTALHSDIDTRTYLHIHVGQTCTDLSLSRRTGPQKDSR